MTRAASSATLALALCAGALVGCAHHGAPAPADATARASSKAPAVDSVTVALWRFDERGGVAVPDAGPFRLGGTAGTDTHPDFGRYAGGRVFTPSLQSFVLVPYNPVMESPRGFSIETWLYLNDVSSYELSTIAARWGALANQQSWLLGVTGYQFGVPSVSVDSPGTFSTLVRGALPGHLVFAFQPEEAASPVSFVSNAKLPTQRWVHVAATTDGEVVRLFIDGRVDTQVAIHVGIRRTGAAIVFGNVLDERRLTTFGGDLRIDAQAGDAPFYALNGTLDELRISNVARVQVDAGER